MGKYFSDTKAVLLRKPSNLFYFSDFKNEDAFILFIGKEKYYFTDTRYFEDANKKLSDFTVKDIAELSDFIRQNALTDLWIESDLSHDFCTRLESEYGVKKFFSIDSEIQSLRAIKTPQEIEYIKKAQEITDKTFHDLLPIIHEGITETELAGTLESLLYVNGADDLAFTSIVAFNENSSMPHAIRTEKKLENHSVITLDFGAKYHNYCSDMTRTVFFGNPSEEYKKTYNTVLTAQDMVLSIAFPGITGKECDTIARKFFEEFGLSKYFIHSLGHGVGIDIHEYPSLSQKCNVPLQQDMVVTVEPGLYFEKEFGIRIEDMIIFHKTGVINLTKSPKNMIIL